MKVKICGMKHRDNLKGIELLQPDYIGFIFYPRSARYMRDSLAPADVMNVKAKRTGVFVDQDIEEIESAISDYHLDCVQLHGSESPEICGRLKDNGVEVIKAFSVGDDFDAALTERYERYCDHFLFDTKGYLPGGNGAAFDWDKLKEYQGRISFFLSGGIGPENIEQALELRASSFYGIDINSRIEASPGVKDAAMAERTLSIIRTLKEK